MMEDQTLWLQIAVQITLGISLAACAGLRAFLPLLVIGILTRVGYLQLGPAFQWIGSSPSLVIFGVATLLEVLGDKFPAVDNFLDTAGTVVKPVAGTILLSAVIVKMDPMLAVVLGIIGGGTVSEVIHLKKGGLRLLSTSAGGGVPNPFLSVIEDVIAFMGTGLSILAPVLTFILVVIALIISFFIIKAILNKFQKKKPQTAPASSPGEFKY